LKSRKESRKDKKSVLRPIKIRGKRKMVKILILNTLMAMRIISDMKILNLHLKYQRIQKLKIIIPRL